MCGLVSNKIYAENFSKNTIYDCIHFCIHFFDLFLTFSRFLPLFANFCEKLKKAYKPLIIKLIGFRKLVGRDGFEPSKT